MPQSCPFDRIQVKLIEAVLDDFNNLAPRGVKVNHRNFSLSLATFFFPPAAYVSENLQGFFWASHAFPFHSLILFVRLSAVA